MHDRGLLRGEGFFHHRDRVLIVADGEAVGAEGAREHRKVRIPEIRAEDAAGIFPLLMHPDRAVSAVVDNENLRSKTVLHGGS